MPTGTKITQAILKKLYQPPVHSHKGDNGRLLVIAGSKKYHGSFVLCLSMAAKIVDLLYVYTNKENFSLIQKLRPKLAEFIYINSKELRATIEEADAILVGPGLLPNSAAKRLVDGILRRYPRKKIVLDAGALRVVDLKLLHQNCVLTPHIGEFEALYSASLRGAERSEATWQSPEFWERYLKKISLKYPSTIVLKGPVDYIAQNGQVCHNTTHNQGMTKGGTGDVLSGLLAGLLTKNAPLLSASAACYVNGLAGNKLKKKYGFYYSASELINEARKVLGMISK